jgi:hypothetical protein
MSPSPQVPDTPSREAVALNAWSEAAKSFYTAGTTFSVFGCSGLVSIAWAVVGRWDPLLASEACGFALSVLIVFAYALVLPEPMGYPREGKLHITAAEAIFGFFNAFAVFAIVLGLKALTLR